MGNSDSRPKTEKKTFGGSLTFEDFIRTCQSLNNAMSLLQAVPKETVPIPAINEAVKLYENLYNLNEIWGVKLAPLLDVSNLPKQDIAGGIEYCLEESSTSFARIPKSKIPEIKCDLCNVEVTNLINVNEHIDKEFHVHGKNFIKSFIDSDGELLEGILYCRKCIQFVKLSHVEKHIKSHNEKKSNFEALNSEPIEYETFIQAVQAVHIKEELDKNDIMYYCYICKLSTTEKEKWERHTIRCHNRRNYDTKFCNCCQLILGGEYQCINKHFESDLHELVQTFYSKNFEVVALDSDILQEETNVPSRPAYGSIITVSGIKYGLNWSKVMEAFSPLGPVRSVKMLGQGRATVLFKVRINAEELLKFPLPSEVFAQDGTVTLGAPKRGNEQRKPMTYADFEVSVDKILESMVYEEKNSFWEIIEDDLKEAIRNRFKIHLYGSRFTNLATENSDYNIIIETPQNENFEEELKLMIKSSIKFANVECDTQTRSSRIRCQHRDTDSRCNIFVNNSSGATSTILIKCLMGINWKVKWMLAAVKLWFRQNRLMGKGGIDPYSMTWLILFYLMRTSPKPMLPPAKEILRSQKEDGGFEEFKNVSPAVKDLLIGFFRAYKNLDFRNNVLCPSSGKLVSPQTLPRFCGCMMIQDPIDSNFNLSRRVMVISLKKFQKCCEDFESLYS